MTSLGFFFEPVFLRTLTAGILLAALAPLIGLYLVTRRYSLLADALAHVGLLGVALSLVFQIPVAVGAFATTFLASLGIERARIRWKASADALMALFLSGSLALAIVLLNVSPIGGETAGESADSLEDFLFGSITQASWLQVGLLAAVLLAVAFGLYRFRRHYFLMALDEDLARVSGVSRTGFQFVFFFLVTAFITLALSMVGSLMIGALLVIPVLTAMQFGQGFWQTLRIAVAFSIGAVLIGLPLAGALLFPSGALIVLVAVAGLLLVVAGKKLV